MFPSFRQSMTWLHTWFGLTLGFVLMIAFFFGALSVFDREIDRWAVPETRYEPQPIPSFDKMLKPIFESIRPEEHELEEARERVGGPLPDHLPVMNWGAYTTHRDPVLSMWAEFAVTNNPKDPDDHVHGTVQVDPRSGTVLPENRLNVGSHFFYPLHYSLHLHWKNLGYWVVGLAALVMLAALVSGVVMHRRIFREFFTFRLGKQTLRSTLDLHNLTGVLALPFHFFFALTGLVIFAATYLPVGETVFKDQMFSHMVEEAKAKGLAFKPSGKPGELASVDAMVIEAKRRWAERDMPGEVGMLTVNHIGDADSYVSIYRAGSDRVALLGYGIHFAGTSGRVIHEEPPKSAVGNINEYLTGLHLQHFEHWLLRWFYVLGGLMGCICIATGFIFFVEKRKREHAKRGSNGVRLVDALAVTTVTGMLVATVGILIANRLLPIDLPHRGEWEERIFWSVWLSCFAHAWWRTAPVREARIAPAWREQCWMLAGLAVTAVLLNWASTGDHLFRTIAAGYWPVAGFDLALLVSAALAVVAARHLRRREQSPAGKTADQALPASPEAAHG